MVNLIKQQIQREKAHKNRELVVKRVNLETKWKIVPLRRLKSGQIESFIEDLHIILQFRVE